MMNLKLLFQERNLIRWQKEINSSYFPNILIAASKDSDKYLLKNRYIKGENLIYVCVNNHKFPVDNVDAAPKLISKKDEKI